MSGRSLIPLQTSHMSHIDRSLLDPPQIKEFHELSGEMHDKFNEFHNLVYEDGHLSKKLKKGLMGLACAILAKCSWCIRSCIRDGIKEGVTKALNIIKTEADMTMALCGKRDVHDLNKDNIYTPK